MITLQDVIASGRKAIDEKRLQLFIEDTGDGKCKYRWGSGHCCIVGSALNESQALAGDDIMGSVDKLITEGVIEVPVQDQYPIAWLQGVHDTLFQDEFSVELRIQRMKAALDRVEKSPNDLPYAYGFAYGQVS